MNTCMFTDMNNYPRNIFKGGKKASGRTIYSCLCREFVPGPLQILNSADAQVPYIK